MAKSKVEKKLRQTISTMNDLRGDLKKVPRAAEKAASKRIDKATKASSSELKKLRDELAQVRDTTARQIADLTATVTRLAADRVKQGGGTAPPSAAPTPEPGPLADAPAEATHGDPLEKAVRASKKSPAKKAPAKKTSAKKVAERNLPASATEADDRLSFAGEALAASEATGPVDPEVPGTAPAKKSTAKKTTPAKKTTAKKTTAKKTTAKKTTAKKTPKATPGASDTQANATPGRKTTPRKATATPASPAKPTPTPQSSAAADAPQSD